MSKITNLLLWQNTSAKKRPLAGLLVFGVSMGLIFPQNIFIIFQLKAQLML